VIPTVNRDSRSNQEIAFYNGFYHFPADIPVRFKYGNFHADTCAITARMYR
jgi:hypothetical protein